MSKFSGLGLSVDSPARLIILDPTTRQPLRNAETGEEAWIEMLSASGSVARAHDRVVTDKQLKMRGRRMTAEEMDADQTEKLAKLTKAWKLVTLSGQPIEVDCTQANARELYSLAELAWLRDQAFEHCMDAGVFRQDASKS